MKWLRAFLIVLFNLLLVIAYLILAQANATALIERASQISFFVLAFVGGVLLAYQPRNLIGYLIALIGTAVQAAGVLYEYASLAYLSERALPLVNETAWISLNMWAFTFPSLSLILLLFPDGKPLSPRWRLAVIFPVLVTIPAQAAIALLGWPNRADIIAMDFAGEAVANPELARLFALFDYWSMAMILSIIAGLVSLLIRFARSRGTERQQLKWVVFGLSTVPVGIVFGELTYYFDSPLIIQAADLFDIATTAFFPLTILIAITRYRLYDIDLIIRRTLLYTTLTMTLALMYVGMVLGLQNLFSRITGQQPVSVIVISTLVIAALFQPLRRRFQALIDRRFYRSKYNAEQALDQFQQSLRGMADLEQVESELTGIVHATVQPEWTEIWVRKPL